MFTRQHCQSRRMLMILLLLQARNSSPNLSTLPSQGLDSPAQVHQHNIWWKLGGALKGSMNDPAMLADHDDCLDSIVIIDPDRIIVLTTR